MLSNDIIRVVYEHGAFNPEMTTRVSAILAIYGLGLPGFVMIKALNPGFFAREDTKTPMRFTTFAVVCNCIVAVSLFPFFAERGIATAEVTSGWISTILLGTTLIRRGHLHFDAAFVSRIVRLAMSAVVMAVAVHYAAAYADQFITRRAGILHEVVGVFALIGFAMVVYFVTAFAIGGASIGMLRRNIRRGSGAPAPAAGGED
jgi:putative peptidoglycan lipid II flippase